MKSFRRPPEVHAGSMADIAFLLLIFFLLSTKIPNDKGIVRKLPPPCLSADCKATIKEKNVLRIYLNRQGEIMVEETLTPLADLKDVVKEFVDNNGDGSCSYCKGNGLEESSDHPGTAVVSLSAHRLTAYKHYIAVQDELSKAYAELRADYARQVLSIDPGDLSEQQWVQLQKAYPLLVSEAEVK